MAADPEVGHAADAIANGDASLPSSQRNRKPTSKARENEANKELYDDESITVGTKTARRNKGPTAAKTTPPGDGNNTTAGDGAVEWGKVVEMIGVLCNEVKSLKEIVAKQQDTIKRAEDTIRRSEDTHNQMAEELKQVHEQLNTITKGLAFNTSARTSPHPSYADVARTPPNSLPANGVSISSIGTAPSTMTDTLYCTIDISRVADEGVDKTSVGAIRTTVEKEIRAAKSEANWRCRAVTRDVKNASRIKIACRDEAEQQLVKQVAESKIALGVRVLRDELFPIKVDNVNRLAVLDGNGQIRAGAAEAFSQENETTVAKIAWLSSREMPKAYGSMVVYVTKGGDARRLLAEGFFHVAGESGYTGIFERRPRPAQCFNCQELGHKAFQCTKAQVCGRCAKEGHRHTECMETILKCVLCGGPHESFSKNCRKLYPSHHE
jgi:hypothetical protein